MAVTAITGSLESSDAWNVCYDITSVMIVERIEGARLLLRYDMTMMPELSSIGHTVDAIFVLPRIRSFEFRHCKTNSSHHISTESHF